jgi:hypothetical protein
MTLTRFPHGIFANPNIGGSNHFAGWFGTKIYYVDGNTGSDGNEGTDFEIPIKTIQRAINVASAGDTIYINSLGYDADASDPAQYVEDLTIPYTKRDLKLIGVGPQAGTRLPYAGPKIKNNSATTLLKVSAPGVRLENLQFNCTRNSGTYGIWFDGITGYATVAGSVGFTMVNCIIKNGSGTYYGVKITGGYGGLISNCTFFYCVKGIYLGDSVLPCSGHTIEYCDFKSINADTIDLHINVIAGSAHDITIESCTFSQATAFITIGSGGTSGIIHNCGFNDETTATVAASTGKITIPAANDSWGVVGCYGGDDDLVDQTGS